MFPAAPSTACRSTAQYLCSSLAVLWCAAVQAQEPEASIPPALGPAAAASAAAAAASAARSDPTAAAAQRHWQGAIGLTASTRPEYSGSNYRVSKVGPALFLRYGSFTVTNTTGLVPRNADDAVVGLGLDVLRSSAFRLSASLRYDAGRGEGGDSGALLGMGEIKPTLRTRIAASWRLLPNWRLGGALSADLLGRGGGHSGDVGLNWDHRFTPDTLLTLGSSLSFGGDRFMQAYYGVTPQQSASSAAHYPVYRPHGGVRDLAAFANLRHDIGHDWTLLAGASATRLLAHAAASPLTQRRDGWSANTGFARRF